MAMLTLNGVLQNVYSQPERKDEKTGEIRPASLHAQILAENVTQPRRAHAARPAHGIVHRTWRWHAYSLDASRSAR